MRMRKKKHGAERLDACRDFLLENIEEAPMQDPAANLNMPGAEVWLEIGAGKGGFAVKMAKANPDIAYIAMEKVTDCVVLAAEGAKREFGNAPCNVKKRRSCPSSLIVFLTWQRQDRLFLTMIS